MERLQLEANSDQDELDHVESPRHHWLLGVASVIFDIDQGQTVEHVFPDDVLSPEQSKAVAFHSFPDSMSMELHSRSSIRDSTFFFRISREGVTSSPDSSTSYPSSQPNPESTRQHYHNQFREYIYGYVFCRQRQDDTLRRGGEQKSLVLLSLHPYSHVLSQLRQWAGPLYFNHGSIALQEIYEEVLDWGPLVAGSRRMLVAGKMTIFAEVPNSLAMPPPWEPDTWQSLADLDLESALPPLDSLQGCFAEVDVYSPFKSILDKIWSIWEIAILAQPLLVVAPSPGECSAAVAAILALIAPLPYSADFRPYYTIHDSSFNELLSQQLPSSANGLPRLLGVTNLFFLKALPQWPNVVSLGSKPQQASSSPAAPEPSQSRLAKAVQRRNNGFKSLLNTYSEAAWLSHKSLSRPNKQLLDRLLKFQDGDGPDRLSSIASTNSQALRQHFNQLTVGFLQPFEAAIQVRPQDESAAQEGPPLQPPFSHAEFLKGLEKPGAIQPLVLSCFANKASCVQFYRHFLESPNFASWFERRRGRATMWQESLWHMSQQDNSDEDVSDVRLVEVFAALEAELTAAQSSQSRDSQTQVAGRLDSLTKQLQKVYQQMPSDLQACMVSSPARAALLSSSPGSNPGIFVSSQ